MVRIGGGDPMPSGQFLANQNASWDQLLSLCPQPTPWPLVDAGLTALAERCMLQHRERCGFSEGLVIAGQARSYMDVLLDCVKGQCPLGLCEGGVNRDARGVVGSAGGGVSRGVGVRGRRFGLIPRWQHRVRVG